MSPLLQLIEEEIFNLIAQFQCEKSQSNSAPLLFITNVFTTTLYSLNLKKKKF